MVTSTFGRAGKPFLFLALPILLSYCLPMGLTAGMGRTPSSPSFPPPSSSSPSSSSPWSSWSSSATIPSSSSSSPDRSSPSSQLNRPPCLQWKGLSSECVSSRSSCMLLLCSAGVVRAEEASKLASSSRARGGGTINIYYNKKSYPHDGNFNHFWETYRFNTTKSFKNIFLNFNSSATFCNPLPGSVIAAKCFPASSLPRM